jgi:hypothetical protein
MNVYGELKRAQLEWLAAVPTAIAGRVLWNTADGRAYLDKGSGTSVRAFLVNDEKLVIGNNGTAANNVRVNRSGNASLQFLIGSDSTSEGSASAIANLANIQAKIGASTVDTYLTFTEASAPSSPASGNHVVYFKNDGYLYTKNSSGTERQVSPIKSPTVQRFTSGTAQTYTTPSGCTRIRVRGSGGGGGGAGTGTTPGTPTAGGVTTFGSSLLTGNGGAIGSGVNGGTGGTASVQSPAISIVAAQGGDGASAGQNSVANVLLPGGIGGCNTFGGAGASGPGTGGGGAAGSAKANTGAGGGGAGAPSAQNAGAGGGAGGYFDAWIIGPSSSYTYTVGAAGSAGTAGTGGAAGGGGAAGIIIVEEFYD